MDKTIFLAWKRAFPPKKALFEAWECQITELVGQKDASVITSRISTHMQNLVTIPQGVSFPRMYEIAHQKLFIRPFFRVLPTAHSTGL